MLVRSVCPFDEIEEIQEQMILYVGIMKTLPSETVVKSRMLYQELI